MQMFFRMCVYLTAWLARSPFHSLSRAVMRALAKQTLSMYKAQRQPSIKAAAREWQRLFPLNEGALPITRIEKDTVYLEIHPYCPLQGTGDLGACNRLMEFDRVLFDHIGAQLVVLASQAQPGVKVCRVALREPGASVSDLKSVLKKATA